MKIPKKGPSLQQLLPALLKQDEKFLFRSSEPKVRQLIERANNEGWNWEQCKYHAVDRILTAEQLWALVKLSRSQNRHEVPLQTPKGKPFSYRLPFAAQRILHLIDKNLGGRLESAFPQLESPTDRQRFLISSLFEEAIASSQIEGAVITREKGRDLLRSGREPASRDEQMVLNNYRTIQMLNRRCQEPLTIALLHEIQSDLTEDAIDNPVARGRFRTVEENVVVWDNEEQQELHVPPPAGELPERMARLCAFANGNDASAASFVHPAIRAIILHFWLGYDHPYVDGNGRTARALFYWSMLRSGYWLSEYLTISSIIRNQPKQYGRAYLNTEIDENDLTYFILYHLEVIEKSIETFREYLDKKNAERKAAAQVLLLAQFNPRQQALLTRALQEPDTRFTYQSHATSHGITLATARSDLLDLERKKLLHGNRVGRQFEFLAVPDLAEQLRKLSGRRKQR